MPQQTVRLRVFEIDPPQPIEDSKLGLLAIGRIPRYWGIEELASIMDVPVSTVRTWLHRGQGPRFVRIGRTLRFSSADVMAWLSEHTLDRPRCGDSNEKEQGTA